MEGVGARGCYNQSCVEEEELTLKEVAELVKRLVQYLRQGKGQLNRPGRGVLQLGRASAHIPASALCPSSAPSPDLPPAPQSERLILLLCASRAHQDLKASQVPQAQR